MPVLKLLPACKDYLWGGQRLRTEYHIDSKLSPLAEAWVLSAHPDGPARLEEGTSFPAYLAAHPEAAGTHCAAFAKFPVLIKLIDAHDDLSVQVHPDDAYAWAHEGQQGKTEMWVVLDAEPGAFLYYGFSHPLTRQEFEQHIERGTLLQVLNAVPVHKGDVFFIPSGTLHAICKGIVIAEVQQNSNVTYRVYDYGRVGADGKPRALHIRQAVDVTALNTPCPPAFEGHTASCPYFTVDLMRGPFSGTVDDTSFLSVLVTDGAGTLCLPGQDVPLRKGDSFFLPAGSGEYSVQGDASVLLTSV